MPSATTIEVRGLGKQKVARLRKQAEVLGLSPERYARELIEEGLSLDEQARTTPFDGLFSSVQARFRQREMTEAQLDGLIDAARSRYHQRASQRRNKRS